MSPVVEDAGFGLAYVDLDGLERIYRTDATLAHALRTAVGPSLSARLGIGPGKFPAYVAALAADANRARKAPEGVAGFLSDKIVKLLPVEWPVRNRLIGFGLHTLGQVATQRIGPLQAQFGPTGRFMWELARGVAPRPLIPRQTETVVEEALAFDCARRNPPRVEGRAKMAWKNRPQGRAG